MLSSQTYSQRWTSAISNSSRSAGTPPTSFVHLSGKDNALSDALSRAPPTEEVATIWAQPARHWRSCCFITVIRARLKVPAKNSPALLFLSRGKAARPLVLTDWRKGVFSLIHSLTLMGPRATARLIAKWYVCPEMSKQLTRWAQECRKCQQPMAHQARSSGLRDPKEILHSSAHRCGGTTPHVQRLQIRTHSHQQENKVFGGPTNGGRLRQVICPGLHPRMATTLQQRLSHIKVEHSLVNSGKSFRKPCAPSTATNTTNTTNKPMAWSNGNTKTWRMPYGADSWQGTEDGTRNFHGSLWD